MAIRTRIIQSYPLDAGSGDLKAGTGFSFSVMSDTGAVSGGSILSARVTISRLRSYSSSYTLEVSFGGDALGEMWNPGVFEDTQSITLELRQPSGELLTEPAFSIVLTALDSSGSTGNKLNYREQCTVTVEVDYEEAEEAPDTVFYYSGSKWLPCKVNYYDGSKWLPCKTLYCPDGQAFR